MKLHSRFTQLVVATFFVLICFLKVNAQNYLSLYDTVFIQVNPAGIKTYHHSFKIGQSLNGLMDFYDISEQELRFFNPKLKDTDIKENQKIVVPIPNRAILRYKTTDYNARTHIPLYHIVSAGQTFYRLTKVYYQMSAEELMRRNDLTNQNLKVGQRLHIGWISVEGIPKSNTEEGEGGSYTNPLLSPNMPYRNAYFQQINTQQEWEHKGLALRQTTGKLKTGFVVFHRYARMNSYLRITNPMTRRTIYAQVIGRIPISLQHQNKDRDVILAYTPTISKALGIIDGQFFADIRFVK
ncbi:MAG: LysM peptidoglycan-binding domain-containing protein [Bacteroidota bacterium]